LNRAARHLAARFFRRVTLNLLGASTSKRRLGARATRAPVRSRTPVRCFHFHHVLAAALILVVGWAAYANSFGGVFVFDDEPAIEQNQNLRTLWPLTTAMSAPPDTTLSGRPIATLSLAIDHAVTGGSLDGYHTTNLFIHLGAALLVFGITRRTLLTPRLKDRFGAAATPLALITALIFVVHPLQTGAVTYIVQRVESLMGLFYLATIYSAIRALDASGVPRIGWVSTSILACALGMATKEVMATAPLMVMLWDHVFAPGRPAGRRSRYISLGATWIIVAILVGGGHRAPSVGFGFASWPWWRYLMTQAEVVAHYLRLTVMPAPLILDYDWRPAASLAQVAVPGAILVALLAATIWGVVRRSPAGFPGAWFFLILAPTSSVLPIVTEVAAEHRMYLPLAGVIALVVVGLFEAGRRFSQAPGPAILGAGVLAAATVVILFARMTRERNADYHNYERIWSETIAQRPHNARARNNYATWLLMKGRYSDAESHLRVAVTEKPEFAEAEANLGVALSAQRKLDEGAVHLQRAVALRPDFASAHRNLGETYALQQRPGEAVAAYTAALDLQPDNVALLNRTAWILATTVDARVRDGRRALSFGERAVRLTARQDPTSLDTLSAAFAELGQFDQALAAVTEATAAARSTGQAAMILELEQHLAAYRAHQPIRTR
jgi:protein O-mannosyl-transferase